MLNLIEAWFTPFNGHSSSLKHENGFDIDNECGEEKINKNSNKNLVQQSGSLETVGSGTGFGEVKHACCGNSAGERQPFKSGNGRIGCCAGKTFDTFLFQCCSDGSRRTSCF